MEVIRDDHFSCHRASESTWLSRGITINFSSTFSVSWWRVQSTLKKLFQDLLQDLLMLTLRWMNCMLRYECQYRDDGCPWVYRCWVLTSVFNRFNFTGSRIWNLRSTTLLFQHPLLRGWFPVGCSAGSDQARASEMIAKCFLGHWAFFPGTCNGWCLW